MTERAGNTFKAEIYIAGDMMVAKHVCRDYCYSVGLCVTIEPVDFIYTGGQEAGMRIGLINYPRFPATPHEILTKARALADFLRDRLYQHSWTIVTPHDTIWSSRRDEDE